MVYEEYKFTLQHSMVTDAFGKMSKTPIDEPMIFTYTVDRTDPNSLAISVNEIFERCRHEMMNTLAERRANGRT